jgi:hypothetical protein
MDRFNVPYRTAPLSTSRLLPDTKPLSPPTLTMSTTSSSRLKNAAFGPSSSEEDSVAALLVAVEAWVDKAPEVDSSHAVAEALRGVEVLHKRLETADSHSFPFLPFHFTTSSLSPASRHN